MTTPQKMLMDLTVDALEDFLCEGSCKNPGMCDGTEVTWCGRKAEVILKAILRQAAVAGPITTEQLDKLQFNKSLHTRPAVNSDATTQGMLADELQDWLNNQCFTSRTNLLFDRVMVALRQAAAPQGREVLEEAIERGDRYHAENDELFKRACEAESKLRALTPAVAPDGAGEVEQEQGEKLLEALTVGRDAVMEMFDYISDRADQDLAEMRLRSIDDALNSFSWSHPLRRDTPMDKEMMKALEADGEKLNQLTGEDHGPRWMWGESTLNAGERVVPDEYRSPEELAEITPSKLTVPLLQGERRALMRKVLDFIAENDGIFAGCFTEYDILRIIEVFEMRTSVGRIDKYGLALMMISQGCVDPIGVADRALAKGWTCKACGWQGEMPNTKVLPNPMGYAQTPCCPECDQHAALTQAQEPGEDKR